MRLRANSALRAVCWFPTFLCMLTAFRTPRGSRTSARILTRARPNAVALLAAEARVDSIIALGGGSSLDCAKAINFLLTNGGSMREYGDMGRRASRCCR